MLLGYKMFLDLPYVFLGALAGLLISAVMAPPTRKKPKAPEPNDSSVYRTETGCIRVTSSEVPCPADPDSLNLLGAEHK